MRYSDLYNSAFLHATCGADTGRHMLEEWILALVQRTEAEGVAESFHTCLGVHRMLTTQGIGRLLTPVGWHAFEHTRRCSALRALYRLVQLQQYILGYLWRPGGRLMLQNMPSEFLRAPACVRR